MPNKSNLSEKDRSITFHGRRRLVRIRTGYSKAGRPMIVPLQWRSVRPSLSPEARGLEVEADALRVVFVKLAVLAVLVLLLAYLIAKRWLR
jgi:hypothetical protein